VKGRRGLGRESQALLDRLVALGWAWRWTGSGHVMAKCPCGEHLLTLSTSESTKGARTTLTKMVRRTCARDLT
jgi:hypothetical protein